VTLTLALTLGDLAHALVQRARLDLVRVRVRVRVRDRVTSSN
jgi:hypothetical protein